MIRRATKKKQRLRRNRKSSITRRRTNKKHSLRRYTKSKKKSRNKRGGSLGDAVRYVTNDPSARGPMHYTKEALRNVTGIRTGLLDVKNKPKDVRIVNEAVPDTDPAPGPTRTPDFESDKVIANSIYNNPENKTTLFNLDHDETLTIDDIRFVRFDFYGEDKLTGYNKSNELVFFKEYRSKGW